MNMPEDVLKYLFQGMAFDVGKEIDHKHVSETLLKPLE